jgi:drug/metabolite transporter (DMT)-like permease
LIRLSWVVFVHAALLSIESIFVEMLTTRLGLTPITIAAGSSIVAGSILVLFSSLKEKQRSFLVLKSWKLLIPSSIFTAMGLFFLFDSVSTVGASKSALLSGPLETVVIILLARIVLHEKLSRAQGIGIMIALSGFFATVMSDAGQTTAGPLRFGDIEAILSAVSLGIGIVIVTKLTKAHSTLSITGSLLLISGLFLVAIMAATNTTEFNAPDLYILLLFSLLPLAVALTYVIGLARIGASLTSVIGSFSILITLVIQLALLGLDVEVILPANIPIAITGGILGVAGIYLVHKNNRGR